MSGGTAHKPDLLLAIGGIEHPGCLAGGSADRATLHAEPLALVTADKREVNRRAIHGLKLHILNERAPVRHIDSPVQLMARADADMVTNAAPCTFSTPAQKTFGKSSANHTGECVAAPEAPQAVA